MHSRRLARKGAPPSDGTIAIDLAPCRTRGAMKSGLVDFVGLPEPQDASVAGVTLAPCVSCVALCGRQAFDDDQRQRARRDVLGGDKCNLCDQSAAQEFNGW